MMTRHDEDETLRNALLRLNARAWGIGMGLSLGILLFLATNILVVRGARMSVSTSSYFRSIYPATV